MLIAPCRACKCGLATTRHCHSLAAQFPRELRPWPCAHLLWFQLQLRYGPTPVARRHLRRRRPRQLHRLRPRVISCCRGAAAPAGAAACIGACLVRVQRMHDGRADRQQVAAHQHNGQNVELALMVSRQVSRHARLAWRVEMRVPGEGCGAGAHSLGAYAVLRSSSVLHHLWAPLCVAAAVHHARPSWAAAPKPAPRAWGHKQAYLLAAPGTHSLPRRHHPGAPAAWLPRRTHINSRLTF
jgi:hypothetical protein